MDACPKFGGEMEGFDWIDGKLYSAGVKKAFRLAIGDEGCSWMSEDFFTNMES